MQTLDSLVDDEKVTVETLFHKNERLRKTLWGHHAAYVEKFASTEEKLDWAIEKLMRLERIVGG